MPNIRDYLISETYSKSSILPQTASRIFRISQEGTIKHIIDLPSEHIDQKTINLNRTHVALESMPYGKIAIDAQNEKKHIPSFISI